MSSAGSTASASFSSTTEGSIQRSSRCARPSCAAQSAMPSTGGRSAATRPEGSPSTSVSAREVLGLGLVVRSERGAARVADQDDAIAAERLANELHSRAEVLQHPLHRQHRVVAGEARVEAEARDAARGERRDEVVAHEVARRVHDDRAGAARTRADACVQLPRMRRRCAGAASAAPTGSPSPRPAGRRSRRGGARGAQASIAPQSETSVSAAPRGAPRRARFSRVHASTAACASRSWRAVVSALAVGTVSSRRSPFGSKK